ncbi:LysE family translocator [Actibacterium sp. 188UL27-1]|uniref:LysE family translocator n=1 Tax=Actibacterium sp. 188UL27-1 TaxID=2786961 RepID=UPI001956302C|nr:LysE family translocator [Actibacterium sp. 188UL27-1]MBM7068196.1 LysE family translocator [Actibacterium sp. 188UL27-1]
MDIQVWLTFVAASAALLLIPGPTVLLVLSYALSQGRNVAVATAAGVAVGDFIAMTASLAGLGALVLTSATLFTVIKWIGAAYLIWMGIKLFRSASDPRLGSLSGAGPARGVFAHAAAVTALNPKSIVFFIAFVPQFLDPASPLMPQFIILIGTFVGLATVNALVYALLADRMRTAIGRPGILTWLTRAGGGALVAMGLATAVMRRGTA